MIKIMIKIDANDRKILKELFHNGRSSYADIGRKVKLSKEVVRYRVNELIKSGFLLGFNTVIDVKKLGWQIYFVSIKLKTIEKENEIIGGLYNHPHVAWLVKCIGEYDILLKVFVKTFLEINDIMKDFGSSFLLSIDKYIINYGIEEIPIPASFLYESKSSSFPYPLKNEPNAFLVFRRRTLIS